MAEKRMFARKIIGSARFIKMPASSRLLYYDLGMAADDEGVVEAYSVIQATGASEDDLKVLASKGFVIVLNEDLVTYILDWKENNLIRKDRFHESIYRELLVKFNLSEVLDEVETDEKNSGIPVVNQRLTEVRLGKDRLEENRNTLLVASEIASPPVVFDEVVSLPLKEGGNFTVTEEQITSYRKAYPDVNIGNQLMRMKVWLESNPNYRKTKAGIRRFINSWLSRQQKEHEEKAAHCPSVAGNYQDVTPVYDKSVNPKVDEEELKKFFRSEKSEGGAKR